MIEILSKQIYSKPFINIREFGVKGDGIVNDTTPLSNYLNYCGANNITARVANGIYKITDNITLSQTVNIEFDNNVVIDGRTIPVGVSLNQRSALILPANIGSSVSMTASLSEGGFQVTVSSTSSFAVDDYIVISSNQFYSDGVSTNNKLRGFVARITGIVSGTVLAIDRDSPYNIDHTQTGIIRKLLMYKGMSVVGNATFLLGGVGSIHNGIILNNTIGALVEGITVDGAEQSAVNFAAWNHRANVTNCNLRNSTSPAVLTTGYGITFGTASEACIAEGNYIENCRHSIAGGGTLASNKCTIKNNRTVRCGIGTSDLDAHEDCFDWTFTDNWSTAGGDRLGGLVARGKRNVIINNKLEYGSIGIRVENFIADTAGHNNHTIIGNTVVGCNTSITFSNDYNSISKAIVIGNNLINARDNHINAKNMSNLIINGNLFEGVSGNTGSNGHAILLDGTCGKISVNDNNFKNINASTSRMCVATTSGAVVSDFSMSSNSYDNVRGIADVYSVERFSSYSSSGEIGLTTTSGNVYSFRNCKNITVSGDVLKINGATGSNDFITIFNTNNAYAKGLNILNNSVTGLYRRPLNIVPVSTTLNGDGTTTSFALAYTGITAAQLSVTIGGVLQDENTYTYSSPNIVFATAPASGTGNIIVSATLYDQITILGNDFTEANNGTRFIIPSKAVLVTAAFGVLQKTPVIINTTGASPSITINNTNDSDFIVRLAGSTGNVTVSNPSSLNPSEITIRIVNNDTISRTMRFNVNYRRNFANAIGQALFSGTGSTTLTSGGLANVTFVAGEERIVRFRQANGVWFALSDSWSTKALAL
jgi:hypothetical protein